MLDTTRLCPDAGAFAFDDPCVRYSWSALLPASFVFLLCLFSLPIPLPLVLTRFFADLKSPFESYLNLHEAEALDISAGDDHEQDANAVPTTDTSTLEIEVPVTVPLWRTIMFAFVGLVEALSWLSYGSYKLIDLLSEPLPNYSYHIVPDFLGTIISPFLIAVSWVYTVVRPIVKPTATPPYDLFVVYSAHFVTGILLLGGELFDYGVEFGSMPPLMVTLALSANLLAVSGLLIVLGNMPLAVPSNRVKKEDIVSFVFLYLCDCGGDGI